MAESETILRQSDLTAATALRDRAILETLYSTGMRRMELINLKLLDLDGDRGTVMVRDYIDAVDIGKRGSCNLFRHTMATLMLENGAEVRFIQAMLGHVSLEITQIYTQVSIRKLKGIHTATQPAKMERTVQSGELDELQSQGPHTIYT